LLPRLKRAVCFTSTTISIAALTSNEALHEKDLGLRRAHVADWKNHPATIKWRDAREALKKDAEAVLPER